MVYVDGNFGSNGDVRENGRSVMQAAATLAARRDSLPSLPPLGSEGLGAPGVDGLTLEVPMVFLLLWA